MFLDTSIANFASADLDFADGICLIGFQINMTRSVLVRLVSPSSDTDTDLSYGDNEVSSFLLRLGLCLAALSDCIYSF